MREAKIEKEVGAYVRSLGGLFYKFTSPGRRAVPDRLVILPSIPPFFIEFKATGEEPRQDQLREHKKIAMRGSTVTIIDSIESGKGFINLMMATYEASLAAIKGESIETGDA